MSMLYRIALVFVLLAKLSFQTLRAEDPAKVSKAPNEIVDFIIKTSSTADFKSNIKLQNSVSELIDFKELSNATIKKFKKELNEKNKTWYAEALKKIITKTVYPKATNFLKNIKMSSFETFSKNGNEIVRSTVIDKGEEIKVEYIFVKTQKGFKVVDVSIDGASWVQDIRDQIEETWDLYKWAGVEKKLNKKIMELK